MKISLRWGIDRMIFCSECGKECAGTAKFCSSCGSSLDTSSNSLRPDSVSTNKNVTNNGSVYAILGWVFAGIAISFYSILFGAGGVIFGYLHSRFDKTHGTIIIIAAIACGLFGTALSAGLLGR